ncbi:MAG: hypothetical protein ACTHKX_05760 [Pseudolysinimonas sp.]
MRSGLRARWTPAAIVYLALAILGLIGTWTFNVIAIIGDSAFFDEGSRTAPRPSRCKSTCSC